MADNAPNSIRYTGKPGRYSGLTAILQSAAGGQETWLLAPVPGRFSPLAGDKFWIMGSEDQGARTVTAVAAGEGRTHTLTCSVQE